MRNKRAQVTLFIIIGIVILISAGTIVYTRNTTNKRLLDETPIAREVRHEGEQEIRSFVDSCLKPIVLQGMEIQRLQGGYIDIPNWDKLTIKEKTENQQIKFEGGSMMVSIDPSGYGNENPFWVTKYGKAIPSKRYIEAELERYVKGELDKCVGDFTQFEDIGFTINKGEIKTHVSFAQSSWVFVTLPLHIEKGDVSYDIEKFNIEIPIDMGLIYSTAVNLSISHVAFAYLEHFTQDLVYKYKWKGGSKELGAFLPPIRFTDTLDCDEESWEIEPEVRNYLKANFNQNLDLLKIKGTDFIPFTSVNPMEQGVYDSYIMDLLSGDESTLKIDYVYDTDWFFNLDILPKSGNTLRPDTTMSTQIPILSAFCNIKYKFKYFYDFPVLLKINDQNSAKIDVVSNTFETGAGYEFHVPLWVWVCGNQKRLCTGTEMTYEVTDTTHEDTAFCDESQRKSGDITIKVLADSIPLDGVNIYYLGANSMQNCFIGKTDDQGIVTNKFPSCSGCSIQLIKPEYPIKKVGLNVLDDADKAVDITLNPYANLHVNVRYMNLKTFVRSWYETDKFTNISKMIVLAPKSGYGHSTISIIQKVQDLGLNLRDVNSGPAEKVQELKDSSQFKSMVSALKGEISLDSGDLITISGTDSAGGLLNYVYPDPTDALVRLGEGEYDLSIAVIGNADIQPVGQFTESLKDIYILSPDLDYTWDTGSLSGKETVTFYSFVEFTSLELSPSNWFAIDDPLVQDGDIKAELVYKGDPIFDSYGSIVGCQPFITFVAIDGRNEEDIPLGICQKRFRVDIPRSEYISFMKPKVI